jgi:hypothetical protein
MLKTVVFPETRTALPLLYSVSKNTEHLFSLPLFTDYSLQYRTFDSGLLVPLGLYVSNLRFAM